LIKINKVASFKLEPATAFGFQAAGKSANE